MRFGFGVVKRKFDIMEVTNDRCGCKCDSDGRKCRLRNHEEGFCTLYYVVPDLAPWVGSHSRTTCLQHTWTILLNWSWMVLFLALYPTAEAYVTVSMNEACTQSPPATLRLTSSKATILRLEPEVDPARPCRLKLLAPETHSISLLITRRKPRAASQDQSPEGEGPKCPFIVSLPFDVADDGLKMSLNLCSEEAVRSVEWSAEVLPPQVTLEWAPVVNSSSDILAAEVVLVAVGRGKEVCSHPGQFQCGNTMYCVAQELVCDGKMNCPFQGSDEDKEVCAAGPVYDNPGPGKAVLDTTHVGWELLASEIIKRLSSKDNGHLRNTEKPAVLVSDSDHLDLESTETLPDVLNHYGPWGYLMLGMLICGTVLMFCGLWECCCRKPKAPVSAATGPTLLIINQGAQQDPETPQTPGPPRYEDLDQPPSYTALFPSSKANRLPITNPLTEAIAHLSSSPAPELPPSSRVGTAHQEVFTIDLPDYQRDSTSK